MAVAAECPPAAPDIVAFTDRPPMLAGDPDTLAQRIRATREPLEFTIASAQGAPIRLIPYHRVAHERYATYWQVAPHVA